MYTLHKITGFKILGMPVHVLYINAKHQKNKEEIHFFYAFPQMFYKKFILFFFLLFFYLPAEHRFSEEMPDLL